MLTDLNIRQSALKSYARCRRRWMFEYLRGIEVARTANEPRENLSMGSIMHLCADDMWNGEDPMVRLLQIEQDVIASVEGPLSEAWVDIFRYLRAMIVSYKEWLGTGITMQERVIASEKAMSVHWADISGYHVNITGTIDRLVEDLFTGAIGVGDLKTTATFRRGMMHAFQLLTYAVLLRRSEGITVERLFTEQVKKVLREGRAKPPYVERIEMFVNEDMLNNHEQHLDIRIREMVSFHLVWDTIGNEVEATANMKSLYPNPTADCSWDCEYLALCTQMDDGSDYEYTIETIYRRKPKEDTYQ